MRLEFKDAEWEITRFVNVPISTGVLSNKTDDDLNTGSDDYEDDGGF